jgi:hypothetical protein
VRLQVQSISGETPRRSTNGKRARLLKFKNANFSKFKARIFASSIDGFYFFRGRADDLIKVSGQWVIPSRA